MGQIENGKYDYFLFALFSYMQNYDLIVQKKTKYYYF